MTLKKSIFFVLIAVITASTPSVISAAGTHAAKPQTSRNFLLGATAASLLAWGYCQRQHGLLPAERYPLMQKRGILKAQRAKEQDTEKLQMLDEELAIINEKLQDLESKNQGYETAKYALLALTIGSGIGCWYNA